MGRKIGAARYIVSCRPAKTTTGESIQHSLHPVLQIRSRRLSIIPALEAELRASEQPDVHSCCMYTFRILLQRII